MQTSVLSSELDLREVPCRIKHGRILQTWLNLPVGQSFALINNHDPIPLYQQFEACFPGEFSWEGESCDNGVRIRITRLAAARTRVSDLPFPAACEG